MVFILVQRYEFLSKSQLEEDILHKLGGCLSLCKDTNF